MLIGPALFTLTFAQFAGPWRSLGLIGAPWLLAAAALCRLARHCVARHVARRRRRASGLEPVPPLYAEG